MESGLETILAALVEVNVLESCIPPDRTQFPIRELSNPDLLHDPAHASGPSHLAVSGRRYFSWHGPAHYLANRCDRLVDHLIPLALLSSPGGECSTDLS